MKIHDFTPFLKNLIMNYSSDGEKRIIIQATFLVEKLKLIQEIFKLN